MVRQGWLEVICGGMYSGKSELLMRNLRRAQYGKKSVIAFKPTIDTRYSKDAVVSHDGVSFQAHLVRSPSDIETQGQGFDVIGIDEAQFFPHEIVDVAQRLASMGKHVIVAGLDTDYQGRPFGPMGDLLAVADDVHKIHAVCVVCGAQATRSQRIVSNASTVLIGSTSMYEARCRKHWSPDPVEVADDTHNP